MKNITALTVLAVLSITSFLYPSISYAITMENGSYQIDSTINYSPQAKTDIPEPQENIKTPDQTRSASGKNYTVTYGFDGIPIGNYFALKNSNSEISFGTITPGEALERTITIDIIPGSSGGFQLFTVENHTPTDKDKKVSIPDTTCDNGNCTNTLTDTWNSPLTYGFGFRCDDKNADTCSDAFLEDTSYRKVPNIELGDTAQVFADKTGIAPTQITITYKINISGSQPQGLYNNNVLLLASPLF